VPVSTTTYIQNTDYTSISDTKFGLFMGGRDDLTFFVLRIYPGYLFRDAEARQKVPLLTSPRLKLNTGAICGFSLAPSSTRSNL
jgi:hypothetical protein